MNQLSSIPFSLEFIQKNLMGPNCILVLEELMENIPLKEGMRVLELGCGTGLTSALLAKKYEVEVYALDLWISATENYRRFQELNVENYCIPLQLDARNLPFACNYFDALISVDSYHYFGANAQYFRNKLKPLLKKNALVALSFPGMKNEMNNTIPEIMKPFWNLEALSMWQTANWWTNIFQQELNHFTIKELKCFDKAWQDWLNTKNPNALEDIDMMKTDNGKYMNLLGLTGFLEKN